MKNLALGASLGAIGSLSISLGVPALFATAGLIVLFVVASRSWAALCGALIGWGAVWLVVIGSGYLRCQSMGADCSGAEGMIPFIGVAMTLLVAGGAFAAVRLIRLRA